MRQDVLLYGPDKIALVEVGLQARTDWTLLFEEGAGSVENKVAIYLYGEEGLRKLFGAIAGFAVSHHKADMLLEEIARAQE